MARESPNNARQMTIRGHPEFSYNCQQHAQHTLVGGKVFCTFLKKRSLGPIHNVASIVIFRIGLKINIFKVLFWQGGRRPQKRSSLLCKHKFDNVDKLLWTTPKHTVQWYQFYAFFSLLFFLYVSCLVVFLACIVDAKGPFQK